MKIKLAIFASGGGSNALKIIEYFRGHENIIVSLIVTNKPHAGVIQHARDNALPYYIHEKGELATDSFAGLLNEHKIGAIILAGYLKKFRKRLLKSMQTASSTSTLPSCPGMAAKACMAILCTKQ